VGSFISKLRKGQQRQKKKQQKGKRKIDQRRMVGKYRVPTSMKWIRIYKITRKMTKMKDNFTYLREQVSDTRQR